MEKGHMSSCTPAPAPNPNQVNETNVKFAYLVDEEDLDDLPELIIEGERTEQSKKVKHPEQTQQGECEILIAPKVADYLFHRAPPITYPQIAETTETHSTKSNVRSIVPDPLSKFRVWKGEEERDVLMSHSSVPLASRFRTNGTTRPGAAPERDAFVSHSQSLNLLVRNDDVPTPRAFVQGSHPRGGESISVPMVISSPSTTNSTKLFF
jgi:hypothetical protein